LTFTKVKFMDLCPILATDWDR